MRRLLVCVLLLLVSCAAPPEVTESPPVVDEATFTMAIPESWEAHHTEGIYLFRNPVDLTNVNIIPQEIPAVGVPSIEAVMGMNLEELGALLNFTSLSSDTSEINGYSAGRVDFTAVVYDVERRFVQWYIVDEHTIYTVTFTTYVPLYQDYELLFDEMISTFEPR